MEEEKIIFCKSGGCTAKLGAGVLEHILEKLPKGEKDPNLLVGYDSKDDASVYRLTDDLAMVQTLDFFPPVVEDPYTFGKIAAANALSDIYAMGGEVRTALNIVCFPEQMDLNVLGEIMRGGAEKVQEAGGSLSGGHSIADDSVKYGLSVTGTVHPDRIWQNNTGRVGDLLILTKPLGTGILCAAHRVGEENPGGFQKAVESMMTLNKYASETARKYNIHACTDVTGFSFLGHLHEMMESGVSCHIWADQIPVFPGAVEAAEEEIREEIATMYVLRSTYVGKLEAIVQSGLPFERYYHWCFCDNFEWLEGESARFGLVNVDYATQTRTIKRSGAFYADMIQHGGVTDEAFNTYVRGEVYRIE